MSNNAKSFTTLSTPAPPSNVEMDQDAAPAPVAALPVIDPNSLSALGGRAVLGRREPTFVIDLSVQIQRGFRIKMLTILLLQLLLTLGISITLRVITDVGPNPPATLLALAFPPKSFQTLILGLVCIGSLPMMTYVRDHHPWNLIVTLIWTIAWAVFLAAAQLPGALILSNTFFVVFSVCTVGVAVLLILCTLTTTDGETGDKKLWSFKGAGTIAGAFPLCVPRKETSLHPDHLLRCACQGL